jgi:PPOX class probable F420-dependent enzyme
MSANSNNNKDILQFLNQKYVNLETYRRNGQAVYTPVWFVMDAGTIYIRTDMNSGKVKRIKNNPNIRVTPSGPRGQLKGKWIEGQMKMAGSLESEHANQLLDKKYGIQGKIIRMFNKIRNTKPVVLLIQIQK